MLVLTRKQNDKIQIGDQITITVLRMKGKAVRLGIEAPADVNVMRGELVFDLPDEQPSSLEKSQAASADELPQSDGSSKQRKPRRHGLDVGQVKTDRWPDENPNASEQTTHLPSFSTAPLNGMVNPHPH
jgi:carbon storage regulator